MATKVIEIKLRDVAKLLSDLEFMVVSLDRLGSAALSKTKRNAESERFIVDGRVFGRLSSMRKLLSELVDASLSPAEIESLNRQLEKVKPWKVKMN